MKSIKVSKENLIKEKELIKMIKRSEKEHKIGKTKKLRSLKDL